MGAKIHENQNLEPTENNEKYKVRNLNRRRTAYFGYLHFVENNYEEYNHT